MTLKDEIKNLIPKRIKDSHKGTYGKVCLIGGSLEYSGAIRLANLALCSLKSGCGMATVCVPENISKIVATHVLEQMIYCLSSNENGMIFNKEEIDFLINKMDVVACGMGLGISEESKKVVEYLVNNYDKKLLLDADALNIVSNNTDILLNKKSQIILTPHNIEFKRLLLGMQNKILNNIIIDNFIDEKFKDINFKSNIAKDFAEKYNVVLLLKGPTTIITDGNNVKLCEYGTPGMSTAGSGDVLSGILAGFLGYVDNTFDATLISAVVNGLAGMEAEKDVGGISMLSSDTIRFIPKIIKELVD